MHGDLLCSGEIIVAFYSIPHTCWMSAVHTMSVYVSALQWKDGNEAFMSLTIYSYTLVQALGFDCTHILMFKSAGCLTHICNEAYDSMWLCRCFNRGGNPRGAADCSPSSGDPI